MDKVRELETKIADFFGAPAAVAVDSCTHAVELCLRLGDYKSVYCPAYTYLSIPMTFIKLGLEWEFKQISWADYYEIGNTDIIDAAILWKKDSYISGKKMCLSFQFRKHLNLGRGGMILLDDLDQAIELRKMSYDGRLDNIPWADQKVNSIGYHYYMTPETAEIGLSKFEEVKDKYPKQWSDKDYPYLPGMPIFSEKNVNGFG
jgi:dTDP-4-amino-4,6-dideoxygalactose transaminase